MAEGFLEQAFKGSQIMLTIMHEILIIHRLYIFYVFYDYSITTRRKSQEE